MLETSNLARKYTSICSFRKYTFQCPGPLNFADVSIFLPKIHVFCPKKYHYSKQQCESCVRDFLVLFSVFVRQKVTVTENITSADSVSGIRPVDCSKLAKYPKNDNDITICQHDIIVKLFLMLFCFSCQVQLLVQVSCQYRHWFWNYNNFLLSGIDQKSKNRKYPHLSFAQYLETGASYGYQIWHECLQ